MSWWYSNLASPIGELSLIAEGGVLREIRFENDERDFEPDPGWRPGGRVLDRTARQLDAYFDRRQRTFELPLGPLGTDFQLRVWEELQGIAYGETISYGELARRLGDPQASRAVGSANGRNPIPIVIPCHRVVGHDGRLTGFGGGIEIKQQLLELESALLWS